MKKPWLIIVGIVLIIGAAVAYVAWNRSNGASPASPSSAQDLPAQQPPTSQQAPAEESPPASTPGAYVAYDPAVVAKDQGRKVLFFHATWCPQCRALEKSIQEGTIPPGVTIYKVNYDSAQDLRQQYGVSLQTTLVEIDTQGQVINTYVAYHSPTLQAVVQGLKL